MKKSKLSVFLNLKNESKIKNLSSKDDKNSIYITSKFVGKKRIFKNDQEQQFSHRKWTKRRFSFKKHRFISSDIKRIGIAKIIVGFKLMIFKFQSKRKNQK